MTNTKKILIRVGIFLLVLGALYYVDERNGVHNAPKPKTDLTRTSDVAPDEKASLFPKYRELMQPAGYVNSDGITLGELIGKKVILLDIMTYSCINCQRTFPYLNAWYEKYKDAGLEIVGIHTPEFTFEKDKENVREALVDRYGIRFPIVLDNEYATWNAYHNMYWPRKYLIDIDGYIVYDHIGEGAYADTEKKIQELLKERETRLGEAVAFADEPVNPADAESVNPFRRNSPETYFGSLRNHTVGVMESVDGDVITFAQPERVQPNQVYLVGPWKITEEYAEAAGPGAKIIYSYQAQKVFLVAAADQENTVTVFVDGKPISEALSGRHVIDGKIPVHNEQLYRFVEDEQYGTHILEIDIPEPGFRAFAFTFG